MFLDILFINVYVHSSVSQFYACLEHKGNKWLIVKGQYKQREIL